MAIPSPLFLYHWLPFFLLFPFLLTSSSSFKLIYEPFPFMATPFIFAIFLSATSPLFHLYPFSSSPSSSSKPSHYRPPPRRFSLFSSLSRQRPFFLLLLYQSFLLTPFFLSPSFSQTTHEPSPSIIAPSTFAPFSLTTLLSPFFPSSSHSHPPHPPISSMRLSMPLSPFIVVPFISIPSSPVTPLI